MKQEVSYFSPGIEVMEILSEGILCGSSELDMDPEEGYL